MLSRQALAIRQERYVGLDSASVGYERGTELNEGLATYVEGKAAGRSTVSIPPSEFGPADVRLRAYATGPALAFLLDRFAPGWQQSFETDDRQTLDGALTRALGSAETCAFNDTEAAEAERQAQADEAALAEVRAERAATFERRPGWRVVVEASADLLWPQGFDPINVERVGPTRVLHARFLEVGNGAGQLELLDSGSADGEGLTEGVGPHPLFNGIKRVEVAGLSEPDVSEVEGIVTVQAPGFTAVFRGASWVQSEETITIRLNP